MFAQARLTTSGNCQMERMEHETYGHHMVQCVQFLKNMKLQQDRGTFSGRQQTPALGRLLDINRSFIVVRLEKANVFSCFFLLEVIYKSSVERARMKSSASSAKAPKAPKAPTSTRRRRQLDYLDYLQSQFPLSLCPLKSDRIRQNQTDQIPAFYHLSLPLVNSA